MSTFQCHAWLPACSACLLGKTHSMHRSPLRPSHPPRLCRVDWQVLVPHRRDCRLHAARPQRRRRHHRRQGRGPHTGGGGRACCSIRLRRVPAAQRTAHGCRSASPSPRITSLPTPPPVSSCIAPGRLPDVLRRRRRPPRRVHRHWLRGALPGRPVSLGCACLVLPLPACLPAFEVVQHSVLRLHVLAAAHTQRAQRAPLRAPRLLHAPTHAASLPLPLSCPAAGTLSTRCPPSLPEPWSTPPTPPPGSTPPASQLRRAACHALAAAPPGKRASSMHACMGGDARASPQPAPVSALPLRSRRALLSAPPPPRTRIQPSPPPPPPTPHTHTTTTTTTPAVQRLVHRRPVVW